MMALPDSRIQADFTEKPIATKRRASDGCEMLDINIDNANINLPAGISTSALQTTGNATLVDIYTRLLAILTDLQLKADKTETQPISGTVTANLSATDNNVLDDIASNQTDGTQISQITQNINADANNSSSANLASGAVFTGTASSTLGVAGIQVSLRTDKNCTVYVDQAPVNTLVNCPTGASASTNNTTTLTGTNTYFTKNMAKGDTIVFDPLGTNQTRIVDTVTSDTVLTVTVAFAGGALNNKPFQLYPWDIKDDYTVYGNSSFGITVQAINSYVRVRVKNTSLATTTYFRLQTVLCPIVEVLPRSLDTRGHLKTSIYDIEDKYGFAVENTPMGEMRVVEPTRLVGATFDGPTIDPNYWIVVNSNGGTTIQQSATASMATNTTANGGTLVYSKRKARYSSGSSMVYRAVVRLPDTGTADNKRRWGIGLVANYSLTISSATVVAGDIYTNNGQQFTIMTSGTLTTVLAWGTGNPGAGAQTYTLAYGSGPATLTGSNFASASTITDGAWFQINGTTFSIVTSKRNSEIPIDSGSFNGTLGTTYTVTTNVQTFEIYWTNSKVWFVVNGDILHTVSADSTVWASSMNMLIFMDNINSGGSISNVLMYVRVASIRRLGPANTQPTSYYHASGQTTGVTLKQGSGNLHSIVFGGAANNAVVTLADSASGANNPIWVYSATGALAAPVSIDFKGLPFHNGLRLIVSTGNAALTVVYE